MRRERPIATAVLAALLAALSAAAAGRPADGRRTVVLLHGLARSPRSMSALAARLASAGYRVCNVSYPSREHPVAVLAAEHVEPAVRACIGADVRPVDFVTHSLGGIIVRRLAAADPGLRIGRVVMLGPPNQGSEIVDELGDLGLFELVNGPAGRELGSGPDALPLLLGPPAFELGVIAGNRTVNPLLSLIIPGDDDGKVSVRRAQLGGMKDFLVVPASHTFMMADDVVISQAIHFLQHGFFARDAGGPPPSPGPEPPDSVR